MIEAVMYVALGFCTAGLIGLAILPAFYRRAARLTEEALRAVNPSSYAEVRAAQDQARARHAVELRRVERQLESEREKAAKIHLEASALRQEIANQAKAHQEGLKELNSKVSAHENDKNAVDLLSAEVKTLQEKLAEAEKAVADSWVAPVDKDDQGKSKPAAQDDTDWMPATDAMSLATITGLEAEVATLKAKLAKYEPVVAAEIEATREETAREKFAELEAQLVDTESKYVSAQAEVTRLSMLLDSASVEDAGRDDLQSKQIEKLTNANAQFVEDLENKERAIARLGGQVKKLKKDLADVPQLDQIRRDLLALTSQISSTQKTAEPAPAPKKSVSAAAPKTANGKTAAKRTRRAATTATRTKRPSPNKPDVQVTKKAAETAGGKSSDIASAAEALVSRIVASNRSQEKTKRKDLPIVATGSKIEVSPDIPVPDKTQATKAKNKDVA